MERLSPRERLIVQLRYWSMMSIADIARWLAVPQRPLYRQIERTLDQLRRYLIEEGISDA